MNLPAHVSKPSYSPSTVSLTLHLQIVLAWPLRALQGEPLCLSTEKSSASYGWHKNEHQSQESSPWMCSLQLHQSLQPFLQETLNSARPRGEKGVVRFSRQSEGVMASKRKQKRVRNDYEEDLGPAKPKKVPKTLTEKDSEKRLIVILENACLETIKVHIHAAIGDPFNIYTGFRVSRGLAWNHA